MASNGKPHRLILCNDGGTLVGPTLEAPMGEEGLVKLTIDPLLDTHVDTLFWQLGTDPYRGIPTSRFSDYYSHRTKVGPIWGSDREQFDTAGAWRIYENTRDLFEKGTDPAAVVIDHGHRNNLSVFLSMRVNDMHDGRLPDGDPLLSPMKRSHPEWLLGRSENPFTGTRMHGYSRFGYDFGIEEVRQYRLAIATEAIENYDLDGFDWDFCRFPRFFKQGMAAKNAPLMTELMRSIRAALDEKSQRIGRPLELAVRVPPTFELAMGSGLDIRTWIDEGIIDILVAGVVHQSLHQVPVEEYVAAARGTGIQVMAQNLGLFWTGRPVSSQILFGEPNVYSTEMCRASAAAYWQAGVDGIYLWNNQLIAFNRDINYDRQQWKEIGDPAVLAGHNKHYLVDKPQEWEASAAEFGAPPVPRGPLPIELSSPGDSTTLSINIADDVSKAKSDGTLESATLRMMIEELTSLDDVEFRLNGEVLDRAAANVHILYNEYWLDFDVAGLPALKQGRNDVSIAVMGRNTKINAPLTVESMEVIVRYLGQE